MGTSPESTSNILLNTMAPVDRERLMSVATRIELERERPLASPGDPFEAVHFVEGGVCSVVAVEGRQRTEVGIVGFEGFTGSPVLLGSTIARHEIYVQVDGGTALRIPVEDMIAAAAASATMHAVLLPYIHCFHLQVSYAVVSCAEHLMEARLARWLLMCHDRVDGDQFPITHEFMAMMISAQRSGVTMTLHSLEGAGMIRSTRGLVTVADRDKLRDLAGNSYGIPEAEFCDLIAPFGK